MAVAEPSSWRRFGFCWTCRAAIGEPCSDPRNQVIGRYPHAHRPRTSQPSPRRKSWAEPELRTGDVWSARVAPERQLRLVEFDEHRVRFENVTTGMRTRVKRVRLAKHYRRETS